MARKAPNGDINKSAAIRELLKQNPRIKATEVVSTLAGKGIKVAPGLVYFIKGQIKGKKGKRRGRRLGAGQGAATTGQANVLATIKKVKALAGEVGGLRKLLALVDVLSD